MRSKRVLTAAAIAIALVTALPIAVALGSLLQPGGDAIGHILEHVLARVVANTLLLVVVVAGASAAIGVALAGLTTLTDFPGRGFFDSALILPLAVPGYVLAFSLGGLVDFQGPLRAGLALLGVEVERWPTASGAVASSVCLVLALYPYVYLLSRQAFQTAGGELIDVAQTLGRSRLEAFFRVSIPAARPWIVAGASLVAMETLADFGTVKIFNFDTLTTAIYSAWYGLFSLTAALQLASVLIVCVAFALALERHARGRARYNASNGSAGVRRVRLTGSHAFAATVFCGVVFVAAFAAPVALMVFLSVDHVTTEIDSVYAGLALRSLVLASAAAVLIVVLALILAYAARRAPGPLTSLAQRSATLGYALPGTVLAVGFFAPVAWLDRAIGGIWSALTGNELGLVLSGTLVALLLAYAARFMTVAFQPLDSGLARITPAVEDAARTLGSSGTNLLRRVHVPILTPALATAALLVFVDVMKELPITLMTRPFGWDTLAVRVFQKTTEGEWDQAALPALGIVLVGLLPLYWIQKRGRGLA